jgi:predicted metal-binding membrane protein
VRLTQPGLLATVARLCTPIDEEGGRDSGPLYEAVNRVSKDSMRVSSSGGLSAGRRSRWRRGFMSSYSEHAPGVSFKLGRPAILLLVAFGVVIAAAWFATITTSNDLMSLLSAEATGAAPIATVEYFSLTGVMMTAMMLPSAIPMVSGFRGLAILETSPREGNVRAVLFTSSYLLVWAAFAALVLLLVMGLGLMGGLAGWFVLVPGGILVAAGAYQFTSWKRYCLDGCQSPMGFLIARWRTGRWAAVRLALDHSLFCLGCCWLLMLVVFVAGAMSLLWMGAVAGLVLAEKVWGSTFWVSRGIGLGALGVGLGAAGLAIIGLLGSL